MTEINYTELYRQNYEDALDEIRNLKHRIKELEEIIFENKENIITIKRKD